MVAGHQDDQRLPVDDVVLEVVVGLGAHEGQVEPAAGERFGEVGRVVAGDGDLDVASVRRAAPASPAAASSSRSPV